MGRGAAEATGAISIQSRYTGRGEPLVYPALTLLPMRCFCSSWLRNIAEGVQARFAELSQQSCPSRADQAAGITFCLLRAMLSGEATHAAPHHLAVQKHLRQPGALALSRAAGSSCKPVQSVGTVSVFAAHVTNALSALSFGVLCFGATFKGTRQDPINGRLAVMKHVAIVGGGPPWLQLPGP